MTAPIQHRGLGQPQQGDVCGPCRLGEHIYCDGNIDLPAPFAGGKPIPLQRCTCRCPRPK